MTIQPNEVRSRFVEMSHGHTRYFEAGSGPDVLLVHGAGFLSGGHTWLPVMPALAEHFHVIAPDCLGFGPGDPLEQPYSFAYLVDHLRELQDVLGIEHSHFVGHSMGGWLGVLLAYESPERVDRFVDVAGGGAATRPLATMVDWRPPSEDEARAAMLRYGGTTIDSEELANERAALLRDDRIIAGFSRLMAHMTNPETRRRYNTLRRLPHIRTPTLVLWGADDTVNGLELGEQTAALLVNARLVVLEGIGHALPLEAPERFAGEVVDFLAAAGVASAL